MELSDSGLYKCRIYEWKAILHKLEKPEDVGKCNFNDWWKQPENNNCSYEKCIVELQEGSRSVRVPPSTGYMAVHASWGIPCRPHPFSYFRHTWCKDTYKCCNSGLTYCWPSCRKVTIFPPGHFSIRFNDQYICTNYPEGTIITANIWIEEVDEAYVSVYNNLSCSERSRMGKVYPENDVIEMPKG